MHSFKFAAAVIAIFAASPALAETTVLTHVTVIDTTLPRCFSAIQRRPIACVT